MSAEQISSASYADSKTHYHILDGLRGVAAIMVVWFHIFEAYATSHLDQRINHGYLAVDFFFILSGFVIGYSYDDRMDKIGVKSFLKRRLVRLQPMVVMGALIGGIMFYFQGCDLWDVSLISFGVLFIATLANMFLIPATVGSEIRGVGEMYPLNGPSWSLLFEYIGNILYALFIHKLSTRKLAVLVGISAIALVGFSLFGTNGDICSGYSLQIEESAIGSSRLLFSFSAGLLLSRIIKPSAISGSFWMCAVAIIVLFAIPRIGGEEHRWMNGMYDAICCLIFFPLIVYVGACGKTTDKVSKSLCKFLGDISYPLYMVHYPFIYLYIAWVRNNNLPFSESWPGAVAVVVGSIILAYICLKLYDEPVRKYLSRIFLRQRSVK